MAGEPTSAAEPPAAITSTTTAVAAAIPMLSACAASSLAPDESADLNLPSRENKTEGAGYWAPRGDVAGARGLWGWWLLGLGWNTQWEGVGHAFGWCWILGLPLLTWMDVSVRAVRQPVLSFLILLSFVSCLLRLPIAFERNGSADADADHGLSAGAAQELARNSVRVLATARWWSPAPRSFLTHRPRRVRLEYVCMGILFTLHHVLS